MNQENKKIIKIIILLIVIFLVISGIVYYWQDAVFQKGDVPKPQQETNHLNPVEVEVETIPTTSSPPILIDEEPKIFSSEEQKKELISKEFNGLNYKISPIKEIVPLDSSASNLENNNSSDFNQPLSKCNSPESSQPISGCNVVVDEETSETEIKELANQIISEILKQGETPNRINLYFYTDEDLVGTPADLALVTWVNGDLTIEMVER